ncbi:winged helix DNA-binding domain-containing protein [Streptomyces armeniacus]|uniref:Winged helix DNA-binding domain-containing protein n=1 Tax=Streptomyces armeniacus TaxID=83291 RepID=A0A345XY83_9ACTN|nr:winged helix DNA-binding domain-containing protein [Streptomyces armeniacus]AXK36599.1 winged helix DNA-binding domain-containing protein [Streptomyces armeniacus]
MSDAPENPVSPEIPDAPVAHIPWSAAVARRLERHALAEPPADAPAEAPAEAATEGAAEAAARVAATLCGAHAQVLSAAELSLAMRLPGTAATRTDIQRALWTDRTLVKTYGPRGTVHLLPSRDLPLWTGALTAQQAASANGGAAATDYLDAGRTDEVVAAIGDALADTELTVDELTEAIVERTGAWAGERVMDAFQDKWPRWRSATAVAAHRGALCFGPNKGRRITYTNPHRWLPGFTPYEGDVALAELVRRYLHAYGPASPQHFARWTGAPRGWAAGLFRGLAERGEIQPVDLAGTPAWVVAGDTALPAEPPRGVRLLPYFDAYSVGCHPRDRVFPGRAAERALAGGQAGNFPVLLVDGTAAGVWHQRRSGRTIHLTVEPLASLTTAQRAGLDAQAQRLGALMEGTVRLTVGPVTVGPHA